MMSKEPSNVLFATIELSGHPFDSARRLDLRQYLRIGEVEVEILGDGHLTWQNSYLPLHQSPITTM
jgi:hypothetical protein